MSVVVFPLNEVCSAFARTYFIACGNPTRIQEHRTGRGLLRHFGHSQISVCSRNPQNHHFICPVKRNHMFLSNITADWPHCSDALLPTEATVSMLPFSPPLWTWTVPFTCYFFSQLSLKTQFKRGKKIIGTFLLASSSMGSPLPLFH